MHQADVQVEKHFCWNYLSSERRRRSAAGFGTIPERIHTGETGESGTQQALQKQAKKAGHSESESVYAKSFG
jgi:hypothetical protein